MIWILIFITSTSSTTAEFSTKEGCLATGKALSQQVLDTRQVSNVAFLCAKK